MKHKMRPEKTSSEPENEPKTDKVAEFEAQDVSESAIPKTYTEEEFAAKANELNDKYLRLYSEFDNFRKRSLSEKIEMSRTASEEIIKELLPVLDDFDRALASMQSTDKIEAVKEGIQLIHAKIKAVFASKGLHEINSMGEEFNTDYHEAITSIPAPTEELKNKVVDEIQKGYMLNDKVIRFSKVVTGS